jgi:hypothetical protein
MSVRGWHVGWGQRQNPFLQLPLHEKYHTGSCGIDAGVGVLTWEHRYGAQWDHLKELDGLLDYPLPVVEYARTWQEAHRSSGVAFVGIDG